MPVEVGVLDVIGVGKHNLAFLAGSEANHRQVFEKFAANGSSSNHEKLGLFNPLSKLISHDYSESFVS